MPTSLSGRDFLRLLGFTTEEIRYLLKFVPRIQNLKLTGTPIVTSRAEHRPAVPRRRPTRTRCAFEVGAMDLGMGVTYLGRAAPDGQEEEVHRTPPACSTVLRRHREFRGFAQSDVEERLPALPCRCGTA